MEYVDGMSLYRAYFVPNTMDPYGNEIKIDSIDNPKLKNCGGYKVDLVYSYGHEKLKGVFLEGSVLVQKICIFTSGERVDCKKPDPDPCPILACIAEDKRTPCKACCYMEIIGTGGEGKDFNWVPPLPNKKCTSKGNYNIVATLRVFLLTPEIQKVYLTQLTSGRVESKCQTGCFGRWSAVRNGGFEVEPDEEPDWFKKENAIFGLSKEFTTRVSWNCYNQQTTRVIFPNGKTASIDENVNIEDQFKSN